VANATCSRSARGQAETSRCASCWRKPRRIMEEPPYRAYDDAHLLGPRTHDYLYFAASVFWRASAHAWAHEATAGKRFSLGDAYQEQFRLYLLGGAGFPANGRLLVHVWSERGADFTTIAPCTSGSTESGATSSVSPGITFILFLGGQVPARHDLGALNSTHGQFVWLVPWKKDSLFRGLVDMIRRAVPSPSLVCSNTEQSLGHGQASVVCGAW